MYWLKIPTSLLSTWKIDEKVFLMPYTYTAGLSCSPCLERDSEKNMDVAAANLTLQEAFPLK
jgi:hypothetical protein